MQASAGEMAESIEVLVFGLGALGSFYGFILSRASRVRLTVVARSNYQAVKSNGFLIQSEIHGENRVYPDAVIQSPADAAGTLFDYVICANKAIDQEAAISKLQPVVDGDKTTIVIIQNGVGNEELFRKKFPTCSIITCVAWTGATQVRPGVVEHRSTEKLEIGLFPNPESTDQTSEEARLETFASLLKEGGARVQVFGNDIQRRRWEKVVWNVAWNSLTALTMLDTQSWFRSSSDAVPLSRKLMREVIDVGRRCGVDLEYELIDRLMDRISGMPGIGSSMQTDCMNGRPLEIDAILGFPLLKAKEFDMETPVLETIHALLRAVDLRLMMKL